MEIGTPTGRSGDDVGSARSSEVRDLEVPLEPWSPGVAFRKAHLRVGLGWAMGFMGFAELYLEVI